MSKIYGTFKTPKGTTLNLIDLKGKPYLLAADRLLWFREENPRGVVKTSILHNQEETVVARAEIYIEAERGQTQLVSSAHKVESKSSFSDYMEKAETSAIARALAMAGYGTQFTGGELDEGDRLADAPVIPGKKKTAGSSKTRSKSSFRKRVEKAKSSESEVEDDL